jgi:hypothetical protein
MPSGLKDIHLMEQPNGIKKFAYLKSPHGSQEKYQEMACQFQPSHLDHPP